MLLPRVNKTIQKHQLLQPGDQVIIAVSGGPDSVTLLHLLYQLRQEYQLTLYIAHLNHKFRGKESDADARFVKMLAKRFRIPCYLKSINVAARAKKEKKSNEEMAREIRYSFLREIAGKKQATKIALGHTADDQVETILMWLLRGTGTEGLTGMPIIRKIEGRRMKDEGRKTLSCKCQNKIDIVRPLLETTRKEIIRYLKDNKLTYRQDSSNLTPIYLRNRIRNKLLPLLEKEYNPNIRETLLRTATILNDELNYFDNAAKMFLSFLWNREISGCFALKLSEFQQLDRAIQRYILRHAINTVCKNLSGIGFDHIEAILQLAIAGSDGLMLNLPHRVTIRIENNQLCFYLGKPKQRTAQFSFPISVPGTTEIPLLGLKIKSWIIKHPPTPASIRLNQDTQIFLNADLVKLPLSLRNRLPGDSFIPLGMKGKKKLHDFYIDEKIPRGERDKIPLLVSANGEILWVVGKRINELYKVTKSTKRILQIIIPNPKSQTPNKF